MKRNGLLTERNTMTLEKAAELVKALEDADKDEQAKDLFAHFWDVFNLNCDRGKLFAMMCGYGIAFNVTKPEE